MTNWEKMVKGRFGWSNMTTHPQFTLNDAYAWNTLGEDLCIYLYCIGGRHFYIHQSNRIQSKQDKNDCPLIFFNVWGWTWVAQVHLKREITWNMVQVNHRCPCKVNPHPRVRDTVSDSYLDRTVTLKTALKISGLKISNAFCNRSKRTFEIPQKWL